MRSPLPLQWPDNQPRTPVPSRERTRFKVTLAEAVEDLLVELDRMGDVHSVVITSDLPTRQDGLPLSNGTCDDPGVAVYFVHRGMERVFACDRWDRPAANIRAIGLTLQALRSLERWAASGMVTRVFEGFAALPAGEMAPNPASIPQKRTWREVFRDIDPGNCGRIDIDTVTKKSSAVVRRLCLADVNRRHRHAIRTAHPDAGGNALTAAELNAARDAAELELGHGVGHHALD